MCLESQQPPLETTLMEISNLALTWETKYLIYATKKSNLWLGGVGHVKHGPINITLTMKFKVTEITQERVNHLHMAFLKGVSGTISKWNIMY